MIKSLKNDFVTDGRTDGPTDRWWDVWKERRTDGHTDKQREAFIYRQTGTKTDDRQKDRNNRQKTIPKVFPGNKCRNVCLVKSHHLFFMIVYGRMYGRLLHRYYSAL